MNQLLTGFLILGMFGYVVRMVFIVRNIVHLWWRKEYRLDRMRIHVRSPQGAKTILGKQQMIALAFLGLWLVPGLAQWSIAGLAAFGVGSGIWSYRNARSYQIPPRSPKVYMLFLAMVAFVCTMVLAGLPVLIALAVSDVLLLPYTTLCVLFISIPTRVYHAYTISRSVRMLRSHTPMQVVGITGSFGKTSVKEYLATIVSTHLPTLATKASMNSPIGIAERILTALDPKQSIFVVEMGAYRPGEIQKMSAMVRPEIGILTAINVQHQDLFRTLETTMKAKYELVQGLVGRRIVIANLDDTRVSIMAKRAQHDGCTVWGYSMDETCVRPAFVERLFVAKHIVFSHTGISFHAQSQNQRANVTAPLLGKYQVGNVLAAIAGACACGMTLPDACRAASQVRAAKHVMQVVAGVRGATFIDDTFNNNPDAAKAAIEYLSHATGNKILVFQPMIELGTYAESAHRDVGQYAASHKIDAVILTNASYLDAFRQGAKTVSDTCDILVMNPTHAAQYITSHIGKKSAVLFKGKDAAHVLDALKGAS